MEKEKKNEFHLPEYYENRELSWLKFDARVLNEAKDKSIPLLERLKFVSITSSNLDEFFMVRVASLKDMVHADYRKRDIAGMTASEQLDRINTATRKLVESQYNTYNRSLVPLMAANGIHIIEKYEELTAEQAAYVDRYFEEDVYPVLTPMAVDASRPFPLIRNKTLNIAALLSSKKDEKHKDAVEFATVQVPGVLPRLVPIPADTSENSEEVEGRTFILLEQIIEKNIDKLFLNYHVLCAHPYRVMRNADLPIDEDADYVYICENNTIYGTKYKTLPNTKGKTLVADVSSCFLSEPVDVTKYGVIYGGVQKNIGPAGVVIVIIREDLIPESVDEKVPTMLQYKIHADAQSLYNTPPAYGIYICGKVFKWLKKMGGLEVMKQRNEEKAKILYDFLDSSKLFKGTVRKEDRSLMNVPFVTGSDELDAKFVKEAKEAGLENLKGHRTVGGMRASIYNAMPKAGVEKLVEFMKKFEEENL